MAREESEFPKPAMPKSRDKGFAPPMREREEIGDGENINIPADAQGFSFKVFAAENNLRQKGEGNYVKPYRNVVGGEGLLPDNNPTFVNENRERIETMEKGTDED